MNVATVRHPRAGTDKTISETAQGVSRAHSIAILGVRVDNISRENALSVIRNFASEWIPSNGTRRVFFTNVHTIRLAHSDENFLAMVNSADLVLPDGSGLRLAGRFQKSPIKENLNGTDLVPQVLEMAQKERWRVFLLGARPDVLESCVRNIAQDYPAVNVVGAIHGFLGDEKSTEILEAINRAQPELLLVAFGSPRQEKWISENARLLKVPVSIGVGGLFDFMSRSVRRAPMWMRNAGLEWVYRFLRDPASKWKRVFVEIPSFLVLVMIQKIAPHRFSGRVNFQEDDHELKGR